MYVRKKQNETTSSLMRRFSRLAQQTGIVRKAKAKTYKVRKMSSLQEKNRAIMRQHLRNLRAKMEKLGKYSEEAFREEKKKIKQTINL